jgi:hypothetical protein
VADRIDETTWRRKNLLDLVPADDFENQLTPEDVCLMERGVATDYRLQLLGLQQQLDVAKIEQALGRMNKLKDFMRARLKVAKEMALVHQFAARGKSLAVLVDVLELNHSRLKREIEVAWFIHEKASLAPWVITDAFVKAVVEKGGSGLLKLSGLGDPSGIGEGYSFLRATKTATKQSGVVNCSEERDLRKKTKVELDATLKTFGYDRLTLKGIERWEKVDLVRHFANLAEAENVAQDMHRYARAPKQTTESQAYSYRERCLKIWKYQAGALSTNWESLNNEGAEDNSDSDDDSVEINGSDIENEIEKEGEIAQQANAKASSSSQNKSGPGRRKAEESSSGTDMNDLRDILTTTTTAPLGHFAMEGGAAVAAVKFSPPERVVKKITTIIKPDGTEVVEVRFVVSAVEVRRVLKEQTRRASASALQQSKGSGRSVEEHLGETFEEDVGDSLRLNIRRLKDEVGTRMCML